MINALTIYEILQAANFKEEQAKAITHAIEEGEKQILEEVKQQTSSKEETIKIKADLQQVATKGDLAKLEGKLQKEIADVKAELIKWMFIFWASLVPVMTLIMAALLKYIR